MWRHKSCSNWCEYCEKSGILGQDFVLNDIVDLDYAGDEENVFASGDFDSLIGEVLLELTTCFVAAKFKYLQEIDRRTFRKTFFDHLHESV